MSNLYIIITTVLVQNNIEEIHGIFTNLQKAKDKLIDIYKNTPDFKSYGYRINKYELVDDEYVYINRFYSYRYDIFEEHATIYI